MRILGVIDLLGGQAVRAVGGQREQYRPVVSRLCEGADPVALARGYRQVGVTDLYLADLDAIAGHPPALGLYKTLAAEGSRLWIDAGLRDADDAEALLELPIEGVVVGLETLAGEAALGRLATLLGGRLVLSLDLRQGSPIGNAFSGSDLFAIAQQAVDLGVNRLLILDLARVGMSRGTGTEELCSALIKRHPEIEIACGGGVRDQTDLGRLHQAGVAAVLVASALHDGTLTEADCRIFSRG